MPCEPPRSSRRVVVRRHRHMGEQIGAEVAGKGVHVGGEGLAELRPSSMACHRVFSGAPRRSGSSQVAHHRPGSRVQEQAGV